MILSEKFVQIEHRIYMLRTYLRRRGENWSRDCGCSEKAGVFHTQRMFCMEHWLD